MLQALAALYQSTKFIMRSATINADIGVRQGAPTSCLLFVIYIDHLMRMLQQHHRPDGFLEDLHALLLMDDTVILATTRESCIEKLRTLENFCNDFGMEMNQRKTKLMVINGSTDDRAPLHTNFSNIEYCNHYVYLGAHFSDDGRMSSVMKHQAQSCAKHVNKFSSFVKKNSNMPFSCKARVFRAALLSSMLYACEGWLTDNTSAIRKHYMSAVKLLLGVRTTTSNVICLIEAGLPELDSIILKRRGNMVRSFRQNSTGEEPLAFALQLCRDTEMGRRMRSASEYIGDPERDSSERLRTQCRERAPESTRMATYLLINPLLETHVVYSESHSIPDQQRIALTRFRLSSHRLRVETGRWSRLAREDRVCPCNHRSVQDERHAIMDCELTRDLREQYNINVTSVCDFFAMDKTVLCVVCAKFLEAYN